MFLTIILCVYGGDLWQRYVLPTWMEDPGAAALLKAVMQSSRLGSCPSSSTNPPFLQVCLNRANATLW